MKNRILYLAFLLSFLFVFAGSSNAAVALVLHIDGITGSSTLNGHANDMDCMQFGWSITNFSGTPSFSGLQVQKFVDKASPFLALDAASGSTNTTATVTAVNTGGAVSYDMYKIVMTNVVITSVSALVTNTLTETVSLRFTDVQWTYTPNVGGMPGTPVTTGWNLVSNTPH